MNTRARRFPLMDSARALAALWVMLFHAAFVTGFLQTGDLVLRPFLSLVGVAPTLFFLISGFLLYRPFARAHVEAGRPPDVARYAWGRLLRIGPAYWVALTIVVGLFGVNGGLTLRETPLYYGFGQIYDAAKSYGGIQQAWTLAVEVSFYVFLPLWALVVRSLRGRDEDRRARVELGTLGLLFLASVAYKLWLLGHVDPSSLAGGPRFVPLPNYLDAFAVGMALAVVSVWHERRGVLARPIEAVRAHPTALWVAAAALVWVVGETMGFSGRAGDTFSNATFMSRWELQILAALLILLPAIFTGAGGLAPRALAARPLLFLGLVSYGFYLYHYAIVEFVQRQVTGDMTAAAGWRFAVCVAIALPLSVAAASLSYYLVERPALSLKRLVGRPPDDGEAISEPAPAAPPAASAR
jgi:peptidoglycan/LPS O-acetylase OafA/YrhL